MILISPGQFAVNFVSWPPPGVPTLDVVLPTLATIGLLASALLTRSGLRAIKETSTLDQRVQAVLDARQYAERMGRLKADVAQLERDRMLYAQELAAFRATVASTN